MSHGVQVSHGAIQFTVYEELKALAGRLRVGPQGSLSLRSLQAGRAKEWEDRDKGLPISPATIFLIGAVSKLCASVVTYPSQVRPFPHFLSWLHLTLYADFARAFA